MTPFRYDSFLVFFVLQFGASPSRRPTNNWIEMRHLFDFYFLDFSPQKIDNHVNFSDLFYSPKNREVEACNHMLAALITFLNHLMTLHSWSENGNLFPVQEHSPEDILDRARTINQFAFYGRCLGFQYAESIRPVLKFIAISMTSFSESYYSNNGRFIKATNSVFNSGKYLLDPELRSRRIVNLSQNASVDFCKVR